MSKRIGIERICVAMMAILMVLLCRSACIGECISRMTIMYVTSVAATDSGQYLKVIDNDVLIKIQFDDSGTYEAEISVEFTNEGGASGVYTLDEVVAAINVESQAEAESYDMADIIQNDDSTYSLRIRSRGTCEGVTMRYCNATAGEDTAIEGVFGDESCDDIFSFVNVSMYSDIQEVCSSYFLGTGGCFNGFGYSVTTKFTTFVAATDSGQYLKVIDNDVVIRIQFTDSAGIDEDEINVEFTNEGGLGGVYTLDEVIAAINAETQALGGGNNYDMADTVDNGDGTYSLRIVSRAESDGGKIEYSNATPMEFATIEGVFGDISCHNYFEAISSAMFTATVTCSDIGTYSGGDGSEENPYKIADANDMNEIGTHGVDWDKYFVLINDINLVQFIGTQFNRIGIDFSYHFTGVFDGNNHTIFNFTYDSPGTGFSGLFGAVYGQDAIIKDLGLIDPNVRGDNYVGALVGQLQHGTVSGCFVEGGNVSGNNCIGGLIGLLAYDGAIVNRCYAIVIVNGNDSVGGLVGGTAGECTISNSYVAGTVTGVNYVGGLLGSANNLDTITINNSYATTTVTGNDYVGGLAGEAWCYISNSYAAGTVIGNGTYVGGLAGAAWGAAINSYWDIEASGQQTSYLGEGKTTVQMKQEDTFVDWDFIDTWNIGENQTYPYLRVYLVGDLDHDEIVNISDFAFFANHWLEGVE